jgi:transcriptional regulator GlxA family with amidase domain
LSRQSVLAAAEALAKADAKTTYPSENRPHYEKLTLHTPNSALRIEIVNTKLNHVRDWLVLARQANWSVSKLAKQCRVSARTLERHFVKTMRKAPKAWLAEQRQIVANLLLEDGSSVKEAAASLGYKHPTHFSRDFRRHFGYAPTGQTESKN